MADRYTVKPDLEFIKAIQGAGGENLNKCYQCATCSAVCELSPAQGAFPRKEMLWANWGLKDKLISDPDVWLCHQCGDCTTRCPRGVRPGDVMAAIRNYIYASATFPSFMGKAMSTPGGTMALFLIPVIIIAALVGINMAINPELSFSYFLSLDKAALTEFVPSGLTEMLFIAGNVLIFMIAFIGLNRFWKGLQHDAATQIQMGFVPALIATVKDILTHKHFETCGQNRPRKTAHILVLYGFILAGAAAGFALVFGVIFNHMLHITAIGIETPIDFWTYDNPVHIIIGVMGKVSGGAGGTMIFIGGLMLMRRRNDKEADVGSNAYPDKLFLQLVFWTGTTGMLAWVGRLLFWAMGGGVMNIVPYLIYFIHIVIVFALLWYMPYSKFAHMLYRTMAMVWAKQRGRELGDGTAQARTASQQVTAA